MRARLALGIALFAATLVSAETPGRRVYLVTWGTAELSTPERREIMDQFDRQLRDELSRRGALALGRNAGELVIVLRPSLEVAPTAITLDLVGVRGSDQKLLGSATMKVSGSSREAQLRALVERACAEAEQFE
jgi:hypothetical protein